jgi:hypothetical protein
MVGSSVLCIATPHRLLKQQLNHGGFGNATLLGFGLKPLANPWGALEGEV